MDSGQVISYVFANNQIVLVRDIHLQTPNVWTTISKFRKSGVYKPLLKSNLETFLAYF